MNKKVTFLIEPALELDFPTQMTLPNHQSVVPRQNSVWRSPIWGSIWKIFKWVVVFSIVAVCAIGLRGKLQAITLAQLLAGMKNVPTTQLILAFLVTALNFVVLSGYDWIAITYLRKKLPWSKIMTGAVIG
jgi:uncharacterized membrane protein YbhN (UPF0104 family)